MTVGGLKVLAVLPRGGKTAQNPNFLNCMENGLGLRNFLEQRGCEYITTDKKCGPGNDLDKHLPHIDCLITTPFHPAYMTRERLDAAKKLKLSLVAGVGSDHIDLHAAADKGLTVAECTGSNVESVAESEAMRCLILMRNFIEGYQQVIRGEWDVAAVSARAWDIADKTVGTFGGGRIGTGLVRRLKSFGVNTVYYDRHEKPHLNEIGAEYFSDLDTFLGRCDIVAINVPLSSKTRGMFNDHLIGKMKKGAYIVNNARGAICDTDAVVRALGTGQLGGYSGDVWPQQPAPKEHPWRTMPNHAMTPHVSGNTIDAQKRFAGDTRDMLQQWLEGKPFKEENYIVREGKLAPQYT